jgi:hypothetical protein
MIRKLRTSLLTIAALAPVLNMVCQAQSLPTLTRHVRDVVANGQAKLIGQLPLNQTMTLDVVLTLGDRTGLQLFLKELYDPAGPSYRHFVTVPEFTARFGPSQADYDAVAHFAEANGFAVVGGTHDGMDVQIKGPVSAVQAAFHVTMSTYQDPAGRTFYAPDREPTADLPFRFGMCRVWTTTPTRIRCSSRRATTPRRMECRPELGGKHATTARAHRLRSWAATCARRTTAARR